LLRALTRCHSDTGDLASIIAERINWLLDQTDQVASARNDAIHAPLISSTVRQIGGKRTFIEVRSSNNAGHPRSTPLTNKKLGNYPPAEPGALEVEPLKAALIVHCPNYTCPTAEDLTWQPCTRTSSHKNNASDYGSSLTSLKLRLGPS
jgi:hypothetical protein